MVDPIGVNGRPRIANSMGTCAIGTDHQGLTTLAGFTSGAQAFLNETNSGLTLHYTAGVGGSTGWNASTAATMVHLQVGVAENPVVAMYWLNASLAHYGPISHYDITWGAGVSITFRTTDGGTTWYDMGSSWFGQRGVFYLN